MSEEIKVHVVKYPDRANLVMRYVDPFTGKQVQRSTKTTKQSDAVKAAGKWESELNEGRYKKQSRMTWEEFTEQYREEKLAALAEASGEASETAFNHVARVVKPERLAEMNTARLAEFQRRLRGEGMRETTIADTPTPVASRPELGCAPRLHADDADNRNAEACRRHYQSHERPSAHGRRV